MNIFIVLTTVCLFVVFASVTSEEYDTQSYDYSDGQVADDDSLYQDNDDTYGDNDDSQDAESLKVLGKGKILKTLGRRAVVAEKKAIRKIAKTVRKVAKVMRKVAKVAKVVAKKAIIHKAPKTGIKHTLLRKKIAVKTLPKHLVKKTLLHKTVPVVLKKKLITKKVLKKVAKPLKIVKTTKKFTTLPAKIPAKLHKGTKKRVVLPARIPVVKRKVIIRRKARFVNPWAHKVAVVTECPFVLIKCMRHTTVRKMFTCLWNTNLVCGNLAFINVVTMFLF